jgi:sarcosine oxidase subunit gamma
MIDLAAANRPLDGFRAPLSPGLAAAPPALRYILRAGGDALALIDQAVGFPLPQTASRAGGGGVRHALWLGPDEWLLLAPPDDPLGEELASALHGQSYSLVDVSCRQTALFLSGPHAIDLIRVGCPLDLGAAAFPIGMCTRTLFGKAEIVLWRTGDTSFHLEVWRSFSAYVWNLILVAGVEFR